MGHAKMVMGCYEASARGRLNVVNKHKQNQLLHIVYVRYIESICTQNRLN